MAGVEVVAVVGAQLLQAATGHVEQLDLHLGAGLAIFAALHDILFAAACGLYHLVYCAVTMGGEKAVAELHRQLVDGVALPIDEEVLPHYGSLQYLPLGVVFHDMLFFRLMILVFVFFFSRPS